MTYGVSIVTPPWRLKTSVTVVNILSRMMISDPAQSLVPSGTFSLISSISFEGRLVFCWSTRQRVEKLQLVGLKVLWEGTN